MVDEGAGSGLALGEASDLALREIADAFPFGFALTDDVGTILYVNGELSKLVQIDRESLVGTTIEALAPEPYRRTTRAALASIKPDLGPVRWEQELSPQRGDPVSVEVAATSIRDGDQTIVSWVFADIRDRVAVERRVRALTGDLEAQVRERTEAVDKERARLGAVMGQMPAGLLIVDAPHGDVVSINDEALRILRIERSESDLPWQGQSMEGKAYEADDWPLARSRLLGEVITGERAEVIAGDGSRIVIDISSAPITNPAGRTIGAVCILTDVTARERREQVEREFVTNAAHELQTPLAALVSAVEVFVGGAKDTPERDLFLGHITRESERLTRLIRSLLILARAEMGTAPNLVVVPLSSLLESIAGELHPAPGVAVSVSCPDDLAALANAELLEQAVLNVAQNAAKYTAKGSISINAGRRGDLAEITVADTGPGISPVERRHVFDRFQRGVDGRGFGLGLAITRSVVEALGGRVELDSQVGVGTTVRLRLPRATSLVES
jgi:PAS domain S-box-containing protein